MKNSEINDNQNFWILKKLALSDPKPLNRQELKQAFKNNPDTFPDSIIPHSSSINRFQELVQNESITESDSGKKSYKQSPMMEYYITPIGIIELLRLFRNKKFDHEIFENLHKFPFIELNFDALLSVFSQEQIFETLVDVSSNTTIKIDHDPFNDTPIEDGSGFIKTVTAFELLNKKNKLIVFYIFNKFTHNNFSYVISERIPIFGKLQKKKRIFQKSKPMIAISRMFECSFFHELTLRCQNLNYEDYPAKNGISIVLGIIRTNPQLNNAYSKFLIQITNIMKFNLDSLKEIKNSLSTKN